MAEAHILALKSLFDGKNKAATYNLGNGQGYSVKEVIDMCESVTGKKANVVIADRRNGDPARLVASSERIYEELGWKAKRNLEEIIGTAWEFHQNN